MYKDKTTVVDHFDILNPVKFPPALEIFPSRQVRLFWYTYYNED
ncbi:hypothetical protein HCUR_00734 [Holospora curviuscula]|uniref:Uncharacterized protein n=1 Tax=Holospora curviuscula TaxID=1082868 RepID=A0A2S5R8P9_9PROT|nr:hypothetical protein HCUR_00734 [Holospora curviuscula]